MFQKIGVIASLVSLSAVAAQRAPDFKTQVKVTAGKVLITAEPPALHHFNTDAPMSLEIDSQHTKLKPTKSSEARVEFEIPTASTDSAKVSLFLCDNAKTFCEKHQVNVIWTVAGTNSSPMKTASAGTGAAPEKTSAQNALDHHGFYDNRPEEAFKEAKSSGKPLMIDFYGIWCPPCNELSDQVFSKKAFVKKAQSFVKLKMDADAPQTEALSQRYGIQGFPTVIFASPEGDEISRVVGFRPLKDFLADMNGAINERSKTFAALKVKADAGDRVAADKVGAIYFDRADYELSVKYLKGTSQEREKLAAAEIGRHRAKAQAGDEGEKTLFINASKAAIQEFPDSPDAINWRDDLASLYEDEKKDAEAKPVRLDLIAAAKRLLQHPEKFKNYDMSDADLYVAIGESASSVGDKSQADSAFQSGADLYRKKIAAGAERGGTLELAYCLRRLGKTEEAAALYEKMQKAYPDEFTFWLADAKMNMQLKRFDQAQKLAQTAFDHSYGANKLDSAFVLAKAWKELGKPDQGKKVISTALESLPAMPPTTNPAARSRIRSRVQSLNKLSAELSKS